MNNYHIPTLPLGYDLETKEVLKQLNRANKKLAELKGVALTIPNENILISTLTLQEAKDSRSRMERQLTPNIHLGDEVRYVMFFTVNLIYQLSTLH